MNSINIFPSRQPSKPLMIDSDLVRNLVEPYTALAANLISVFHQKPDEEKREADQQHYRENMQLEMSERQVEVDEGKTWLDLRSGFVVKAREWKLTGVEIEIA